MVQSLDPEPAKKLQFLYPVILEMNKKILDPEIVEMVQFVDPESAEINKISGSRNRRNGAISGSRNRRKGQQILYLNFSALVLNEVILF